MTITPDIIKATRKWLGADGIAFFTEQLLIENDWIHLHFTSGMQVRNFLRGLKQCFGWSDHEFDDNWIEIVRQAIIEN